MRKLWVFGFHWTIGHCNVQSTGCGHSFKRKLIWFCTGDRYWLRYDVSSWHARRSGSCKGARSFGDQGGGELRCVGTNDPWRPWWCTRRPGVGKSRDRTAGRPKWIPDSGPGSCSCTTAALGLRSAFLRWWPLCPVCGSETLQKKTTELWSSSHYLWWVQFTQNYIFCRNAYIQ